MFRGMEFQCDHRFRTRSGDGSGGTFGLLQHAKYLIIHQHQIHRSEGKSVVCFVLMKVFRLSKHAVTQPGQRGFPMMRRRARDEQVDVERGAWMPQSRDRVTADDESRKVLLRHECRDALEQMFHTRRITNGNQTFKHAVSAGGILRSIHHVTMFFLAETGGDDRVGCMEILASDYEKMGRFYLGRTYDWEKEALLDELVLYDSKDLVTHGVVLGMTGSGKTGLCLAMLEEAAMDNIPAIIIDPKGDIANLLLTFPDLTAEHFLPWVNEDDANKKGISIGEHAAATAAQWKKGLGEWGQSGERIRQFREKVDINVFTPGSKAGIPVSIMSSLAVPPFEILDDGELLGERIESTVSSLLSLAGINDEDGQSPAAVLLGAVFQSAWAAGQDLSLETLIRHIQKPAFDKVGVMDMESFMPQKDRQALALKFNNLLALPGFANWREGAPLDIAKMMTAPDGKPRMSIFSLSHLSDDERMFFVSLLLNQLLGWMRAQSGTTSLRAMLYMDEIFGFLPPTANPPSKKPFITLLKQSRAFGLGCLLATQNPVDLDYKALSNIGSWFLGRLQTERDKLRVLDGLEGAAGAQNAKFDRKQMDQMLSGLGNRIFLMNNIHDDEPEVFQVRWVMSYLRGPLTRTQIKTLMDPKRAAFESQSTATANPMALPGADAAGNAHPVVGAGVSEFFAAHSGESGDLCYRPHLLRVGTVHFEHKKSGISSARNVRTAHPILASGIDWTRAVDRVPKDESLVTQAAQSVGFAELPGYAMNKDSYAQAGKEFSEQLYREQRAELLCCETLDAWSKWEESEADFRARLALRAREERDAAIAKLRETLAKKLQGMQGRLQMAQSQLERQKAEASSAKMSAGLSILTGILGALFGGKGRSRGLGSLTRGKSVLTSATGAYKQGKDVSAAEQKISLIEGEIASLEKQAQEEMDRISAAYETGALKLSKEVLKPTRADVKVEGCHLLWLPYDRANYPAW
jgi:hypothetical protein